MLCWEPFVHSVWKFTEPLCWAGHWNKNQKGRLLFELLSVQARRGLRYRDAYSDLSTLVLELITQGNPRSHYSGAEEEEEELEENP